MKRLSFFALLCGFLIAPYTLQAEDELAILVDGIALTNGQKSTETICMEDGKKTVHFEVQTDKSLDVVSVDWDFGDGITRENEKPEFDWTYTAEGWFDVKAVIHANPVYGEEEEDAPQQAGEAMLTLDPITVAFSIAYCPPKCLDLKIHPDQAIPYGCGETAYEMPCSFAKGAKAGKAFFITDKNEKYAVTIAPIKTAEDGRVQGVIAIPSEKWKPGIYGGHITIEDAICGGTTETARFEFAVRYPQNIFAMKFNNVLAVYLRGKGGNTGYDFKAYQWYRNEEPIPGATNSIYHTDAPFTPGDTYFVELTDQKNVKFPSCPFEIPEELDDYTPKKTEPAAVKALINDRMCIQLDDMIFDMFGQRIK